MSGALPFSGPCPTLYGGTGPASALRLTGNLLTECRPPAVQVHAWQAYTVADALRALVPGVVVLFGYGLDGVAGAVTSGAQSVAWGVQTMTGLAGHAHDAGAAAVVWDPERAYAQPAGSPARALVTQLVREGLAAVAAAYPALQQWHTTYDQPTLHAAYDWGDWLYPNSPLVVELPQIYAAPADPAATAPRGALAAREAAAAASWQRAQHAGLFTPPAGLQWLPYLQAHNVPAESTIAVALGYPLACLWAYPNEMDAAGRNALRALCDLYRRGLWQPDGVAALQRAAGASPDGIYGARTAAAAGVRWE